MHNCRDSRRMGRRCAMLWEDDWLWQGTCPVSLQPFRHTRRSEANRWPAQGEASFGATCTVCFQQAYCRDRRMAPDTREQQHSRAHLLVARRANFFQAPSPRQTGWRPFLRSTMPCSRYADWTGRAGRTPLESCVFSVAPPRSCLTSMPLAFRWFVAKDDPLMLEQPRVAYLQVS